MDFLETLRSVGGVKPCSICPPPMPSARGINLIKEGTDRVIEGPKSLPENMSNPSCSSCHGTGQVLDLAPLLAKPIILATVVHDLFFKNDDSPHSLSIAHVISEHRSRDTFHIVGPQRTSNLIYEVARQLGGTAVIVYSVSHMHPDADLEKNNVSHVHTAPSLPIPPDSTVLFVTDRLSDETAVVQRSISVTTGGNAFEAIILTVNDYTRAVNYLPYVLCLVDSRTEKKPLIVPAEWNAGTNEHPVGECGAREFQVISLYQE